MIFIEKIKDNRKLILTILVIAVTAFLIVRPFETDVFAKVDNKSEEYLNKTITKATITYAGLRTMNAVISVIQSISVNATFKVPLVASGGGSISIGELFDPLNDLIERCSVVILFSLASLGIQKIILSISPVIAFQIVLPISFILFLFSLWISEYRGFDFRKAALKIAVLALVIRFCIPFAALLNEKAGALIIDQKYEDTRGEIVELEESLNEAKTSFSISSKLKSVLESIKNTVSGKISYFIDMIIIFIFQTAVLPLAVLYMLVKFPGFAVNSLNFSQK